MTISTARILKAPASTKPVSATASAIPARLRTCIQPWGAVVCRSRPRRRSHRFCSMASSAPMACWCVSAASFAPFTPPPKSFLPPARWIRRSCCNCPALARLHCWRATGLRCAIICRRLAAICRITYAHPFTFAPGARPPKIKCGPGLGDWRRGGENRGGGFLKGSAREREPNIQLYFNPLSYTIPKDPKAKLKPDPYSGFLLAYNPCRPDSRGSIEIAAADADLPAAIRPNYLSTPKDRDEAVQGARLIRALSQAPALRALIVEEVSPAGAVTDEAGMLQFFREQAGSIYHLCGSCAMGPDAATAVVDAELKVHGVQRLRVVDASVFPNITSGNINAATMMVAEKGAAMILGEYR